MKITPLTYDLEREIFARRKRTDRQAERVAAKIVGDVRRRGDKALFEWSNMFGGRVTAESIWVGPAEMKAAARRVSRPFLTAVDHAARNIRRVARMQKPKSWSVQVEPGVRVAQRVEPLAAVGCYIPGGRFSLVSTLLMTVIPAQEAGVKRIVATSPGPGDALLAVASRLGLEGVARIGGAQAVAALAYGTDSIPRVDKICGPGNRYVTAAKRVVSADCAIDMAGRTDRGDCVRGAGQRRIHGCGFNCAGGARSRCDRAICHDFEGSRGTSGARDRTAARSAAGEESRA